MGEHVILWLKDLTASVPTGLSGNIAKRKWKKSPFATLPVKTEALALKLRMVNLFAFVRKVKFEFIDSILPLTNNLNT